MSQELAEQAVVEIHLLQGNHRMEQLIQAAVAVVLIMALTTAVMAEAE
jgi:hypothetical protein